MTRSTALAALLVLSPLQARADALGELSRLAEASGAAPDRVRPGTGGGAVLVPGSIFDDRPVADSPGHGWAPADALIRRLLGREDRRFAAGFTLADADESAAEVFLYGERHSDRALIQENMRRLAGHLRAGRPTIVLDEGYLGPRLYGREAGEYLEAKGFEPGGLPRGTSLELRGWDDPELYRESNRAVLQYTMDLEGLKTLAQDGGRRGRRYYGEVASAGVESVRDWLAVRRVTIGRRNRALDRAVAEALADAASSGAAVHVIAGAEHLLERPLLAGKPIVGRPRLRKGLLEAIGERHYWASKPADSSLSP